MSMNFSGFDKEFFMDLHKIAQDIVQKIINKDCFSDAIFNEHIKNYKTLCSEQISEIKRLAKVMFKRTKEVMLTYER